MKRDISPLVKFSVPVPGSICNLLLGWILLAGALSACLPIATPPPAPTETSLPPTPTLTLTPSPVWFPATSTPTPPILVPQVLTPTQDMTPRYGGILLSDDFSDGEAWNLGQVPAGSAALSKNELTIAVSQRRGYVSSFRSQPTLRDFYAEITASPSICRGGDEYGLLVRVSPSENSYRFGLTCRGEVHLERVIGDKVSNLVTYTLSGAVPPGAPSSSRLAVWAVGRDLRFYVNDQFQFSIRDGSLVSGGIGVFARASTEDSVTVNFSALEVYESAR